MQQIQGVKDEEYNELGYQNMSVDTRSVVR